MDKPVALAHKNSMRHSVFVFLVASTMAHGAEPRPSFPGRHWESCSPEQAGLSSRKLVEFSAMVGGRGCVVFTWGDQAKSSDLAFAFKPVLSTLLLMDKVFRANAAGRRLLVDAPPDTFVASGHGGIRALVVIPSLDLIASWNDSQIDDHDKSPGNPDPRNNCVLKLLVEACRR